MDSNRVIIGSGLIIILTGAITAISEDKPPWRIIGGGLGVVLLLSLVAALGEGPAKIAGGLAAVAAGTVVMTQAIPLFDLASSLGKEG